MHGTLSQTETWQTYLAAQLGLDSFPMSGVSLPDFTVINGIMTTMLAAASHQCVHDLMAYLQKSLET
jgi:hypothetical protein